MKWLAASICLVFMAGAVNAAGNNSDLPEPGVTPGSFLFGLEQVQESISLALTFDPVKKAHKRIHIAQERLAEAQELSKSNNSANAEKAIKMHTRAMEKASQAIQNIPEENRGNLVQELNSTHNQSISVLQDLKNRLPESAMEGINTAIEAHRNQGVGNRPEDPRRPNNRPDQNITQPGNTTEQPSRPDVDGGQELRPSGYRATGRVVRDS